MGRVFECQGCCVASIIKGLLVIDRKEIEFLFVTRDGGESFVGGLGHFFYQGTTPWTKKQGIFDVIMGAST